MFYIAILLLLGVIFVLARKLIKATQKASRDAFRIEQLHLSLNSYREKIMMLERDIAARQHELLATAGLGPEDKMKAARTRVNDAYSKAIADWDRQFSAKRDTEKQHEASKNYGRRTFDKRATEEDELETNRRRAVDAAMMDAQISGLGVVSISDGGAAVEHVPSASLYQGGGGSFDGGGASGDYSSSNCNSSSSDSSSSDSGSCSSSSD